LPHCKEVVPLLVPLLKDTDLEFRRSVIGKLRGIGDDARDAIPHLLPLLKDPELRWTVVNALENVRGQAGVVLYQLPPVIAAWKTQKNQATLSWVFSVYKAYHEDAIPYLTPLLQDPDPEVRRDTVHALQELKWR